jgi:hypothetical protein
MGPRIGVEGLGKSPPTGIRSPDRPGRSESLYRLSYPGTGFYSGNRIKNRVSLVTGDA